MALCPFEFVTPAAKTVNEAFRSTRLAKPYYLVFSVRRRKGLYKAISRDKCGNAEEFACKM